VITCLFSCDGCGLEDAEVRVRARESHEPVGDWWEGTLVEATLTHHSVISPVCMSRELRELKVPVDPNDPGFWIGKQTDLVPPKGKH
jgi:hypothetical protein